MIFGLPSDQLVQCERKSPRQFLRLILGDSADLKRELKEDLKAGLQVGRGAGQSSMNRTSAALAAKLLYTKAKLLQKIMLARNQFRNDPRATENRPFCATF